MASTIADISMIRGDRLSSTVPLMVSNSLRWAIRDLDAMPNNGGGKRYEIIDGEVFVTRAPTLQRFPIA